MRKINVMLAVAALTMGIVGTTQAAPYAGYTDKLAGVQGNTDSNVIHLASGVKETDSSVQQSTMQNYDGLKKSGYWCSPTSHDSYLTSNCGEAFATDKAINKILTTYDDNDKYLYDQIYGTIVTDSQGNTIYDEDGETLREGGILGKVDDALGDPDALRANVQAGDAYTGNDGLGTAGTIVGAINSNSDRIDAEIAARKGADAQQDKVINQINQNVANGFNALTAADVAEAAAREAGDAAEKQAREEADAAEKAAREAADAAEKQAREEADAAEQAARIAADAAEKQAREEADAAEKAAREEADAAEQAARIAGDAAEKAEREAADAAERAERIAGDQALRNRIDQVETNSNKGIARAVALAGLHPLDFDRHNKLDIALASGHYKNENAFAIGAFYRPNRDVMLSFGTTLAGNDDAYNFGLSFKIGHSSEKTEKAGPTTEELYAMISAMQAKIDAQQTRIEELEAK